MLTEVLQAPKVGRPFDEADADWNRLARLVEERVVERLGNTVEMIDEPLRRGMRTVVDRAAERLGAEIQDLVREVIEGAVGRAVTDAVAQLREESEMPSTDSEAGDHEQH
ncbi:MAG: hypothetical protein H6934_11295 [Burkholderiaceae bacterium]|nr:hypothetical protein [Burkholderiaceae bacterium]